MLIWGRIFKDRHMFKPSHSFWLAFKGLYLLTRTLDHYLLHLLRGFLPIVLGWQIATPEHDLPSSPSNLVLGSYHALLGGPHQPYLLLPPYFDALDQVSTIFPSTPIDNANLFRKETGWGKTEAWTYVGLMYYWYGRCDMPSDSTHEGQSQVFFPRKTLPTLNSVWEERSMKIKLWGTKVKREVSLFRILVGEMSCPKWSKVSLKR